MIRPPFTDERVDQLLRDAAADEAEHVAASVAAAEAVAQRLASRVDAGTMAGLGSRRSVMAFAMVLLLGLLLGGAIAIGSGLLRLPWLPEVDSPAFGLACPPQEGQQLQPGQVLSITFIEPAGGIEDEPVGSTLVLYEDGRLILASAGRSDDDIRAGESAMQARRMSPVGSRRLREFILHSPLLQGCGVIAADGDRSGSMAVMAGDATRSAAWRPWGAGVRPMNGALMTATDQLEERLSNLDAWLESDAWQDDWAPYDPATWLLAITDVPASAVYQWGVTSDVNAVALDELEAQLGTSPFAGWQAWRHDNEGRSGRCTLGDYETAQAVVAALEASGSEVWNQHWWLRDGEDYIAVEVSPLLPQVSSCLDVTESGAGVSGGSARHPEGIWTQPCDVVSPAALVNATGRPDDVVVTAHLGPSDLGPQFTRCSYTWGASVSDYVPGVQLFVYAQEISRAGAEDVVGDIFGPDAVETAIAGGSAWRNACASASTPDAVVCQPAVAVADDQYLVVVVAPPFDPSLETEEALRGIAELLVRRAGS